ncbi:MAG: helix-turn-helix domain-containing protein [Nitrospira sp.]|nr:helix-turn-helix domain-containing protein [Nitrospira sp.]
MKRHSSKPRSFKFDHLPDWMTVVEARTFLRLSRSTMYDRLRSGEIPARKFGRQFRIPKESLRPTGVDAL